MTTLAPSFLIGSSSFIRHKAGCTVTCKIVRGTHAISDLGIVLYLFSENKGADQLSGYLTAELCLCFRTCKTGFLMTRLICVFPATVHI